MTINELQNEMKDGTLSAVDLVKQTIKKIEDENPNYNAILSIADDAIEQAKRIDEARANGEELGPLAGVPIILKDNMLVTDWEVTAASQVLEGHKASYDATVVERLKAAGAIILARANMDDAAMGSTNETSHYGPAKNPWDTTKVPGGSSGGSAIAVAAGFSPIALGSDTGGSVRLPAALCGITGLKPTYGRVSRYGLIAFSSSLDQIGPFAHNVEDIATVMQVIEGKDERDATSVELPETTIPELIDTDLKGMKIGLPKEYFVEGMDERIKALVMDAANTLKARGAEIVDISLPHAEYALATYYIIAPAEASSNLGRYDGVRYGYFSQGKDLTDTYMRTRGEGFGREVQRRIMLGSYTLSAGYYDAYYKKALKVRTLIKRDFDEALKQVDAILTPTSPSVAWGIGEKFDDPVTMYLSDIYTVSANLAGIPALSLPCGFVDGLPAGMQLMGRPFDEYTLYRIGKAYQEETNWHTQTP